MYGRDESIRANPLLTQSTTTTSSLSAAQPAPHTTTHRLPVQQTLRLPKHGDAWAQPAAEVLATEAVAQPRRYHGGGGGVLPGMEHDGRSGQPDNAHTQTQLRQAVADRFRVEAPRLMIPPRQRSCRLVARSVGEPNDACASRPNPNRITPVHPPPHLLSMSTTVPETGSLEADTNTTSGSASEAAVVTHRARSAYHRGASGLGAAVECVEYSWVYVNSHVLHTTHMPSVSALPDGTLVVAFHASRYNEGDTDQQIMLATSRNGGKRFDPPKPAFRAGDG